MVPLMRCGAGIYSTIYVANFILERLPALTTVPEATRKQVLAEARFMRGWANFIGVYTYGDIPKVTSTDQAANTTHCPNGESRYAGIGPG